MYLKVQTTFCLFRKNSAGQTRPTDSEDLMDILRLRQVEMDFLSIMSPILDFASVGRIAQPLTIQV